MILLKLFLTTTIVTILIREICHSLDEGWYKTTLLVIGVITAVVALGSLFGFIWSWE